MNRRELLFGVAAVAITPALPINPIRPEVIRTVSLMLTEDGWKIMGEDGWKPTRYLAANDDFAMAA